MCFYEKTISVSQYLSRNQAWRKSPSNNTLTWGKNSKLPHKNHYFFYCKLIYSQSNFGRLPKTRDRNPYGIYLGFCLQFLYCAEGVLLSDEKISLHIMFLPTIVRQTFIFILRIQSTMMLLILGKLLRCTSKNSINRSTVKKPKLVK